MHRDTKLGLALGMLVIGFAVAFCFPRDTRSRNPKSSAASNSIAVHPDLEFIPVRAYNEHSTSPPPVVPPTANAPQAAAEAIEVPVPPPLEPRPATTTASELQPELPPTANVKVPPLTHKVEAGDTLSGIAQQHLGNSQRYYDLFLANQDQLSTPDALKIGMILRIPPPSTSNPRAGLEQPLTASNPQPFSATSDPVPNLALPAQHTVQAGETLEGIARHYYGDPTIVPQLRAANPHLRDPQKLAVGTVIDLPITR